VTRALAVCCLAVTAIVCFAGRADAANCSVSTTPVLFGTYDVFTPAALDSVGSIVLDCNGARDVVVSIDQGRAGTFTPRKLYLNTTEWLGYNLYRDPARAMVWGDGTSGTSFYYNPRLPNNEPVSLPIFGRIPAGQDVRAGTYSDNLSVTINF
jgi:spore coat protein U-like protein